MDQDQYVAVWDDIIHQGATFYRVVTLLQPIDDSIPFNLETNSMPVDLTGKTPRSTLMTKDKGTKVADFACAVLDAAAGTLAWTMSREVTAELSQKVRYFHNIDLDHADGVTTSRAVTGSIVVAQGQPPEVPA